MARLERDTLLTIGIAFLCVVAIATAAGTLGSVLVPDGEGTSGVDASVGDDSMPGSDSGGDNASSGALVEGGGGVEAGRITKCVRPLTGPLGLLAYFGPVAFLFYLLARRYNASTSMLVGYASSPFIVLMYFFLTACPTAGGEMPGESNGQSPLETVAETELLGSTTVSPIVPAALFGVVLLGVVILFYTSTDDEQQVPDEEEIDEGNVEELGRAAGEAADRLEERNADVDNEVYRAWREMTELLDVSDPETSTPGTFASAAIDAGIRRQYVTDLTRLFEEVRYGHEDAEAREENAVEIFRKIEAEYAPEEGADGTGPGEPTDETDESDTADQTMTDDTADRSTTDDTADRSTTDDTDTDREGER